MIFSYYLKRIQHPLGKHMSTVRKTITVTDQQDLWIATQVQAGRFTNDSELIRDLIRREQERSADIELIRQALVEGERSGEPQAFDFAAFLQQKRRQYGA
jgi:antitoxin ParD1/3/4